MTCARNIIVKHHQVKTAFQLFHVKRAVLLFHKK